MDPTPSPLVVGSREGARRILWIPSCGIIGIIPKHSNKSSRHHKNPVLHLLLRQVNDQQHSFPSAV